MKEWLEIRLSWLRKPYLVRQYTTYYETLEWVGKLTGTHYIDSAEGIRKGIFSATKRK